MQLNIGEPNQHIVNDVGERFQIRDVYGLLLDPKLYAKPTCTRCGGNGIFVTSLPVTPKQVKEMVAKDPASIRLVVQDVKRTKKKIVTRNVVRHTSTCLCVPKRYDRAKQKLIEALAARAANS